MHVPALYPHGGFSVQPRRWDEFDTVSVRLCFTLDCVSGFRGACDAYKTAFGRVPSRQVESQADEVARRRSSHLGVHKVCARCHMSSQDPCAPISNALRHGRSVPIDYLTRSPSARVLERRFLSPCTRQSLQGLLTERSRGILRYSFPPEEIERQFVVGELLTPSRVEGGGHYCALIQVFVCALRRNSSAFCRQLFPV